LWTASAAERSTITSIVDLLDSNGQRPPSARSLRNRRV
jgi:hypothetical protein